MEYISLQNQGHQDRVVDFLGENMEAGKEQTRDKQKGVPSSWPVI